MSLYLVIFADGGATAFNDRKSAEECAARWSHENVTIRDLDQEAKDRKEMLDQLAGIQWGHGGDCDPGCPLCGARETEAHHDRLAGQHAEGCGIGALLKRLGRLP